MSLIKCPECGREVSDRARTCPHCGVDIAGQITTCPHCGEVVFIDDETCPYCHKNTQSGFVSSENRRTPVTAIAADVDTTSSAIVPKNPKPKKKKRGLTLYVVALVIALVLVSLGLFFYQYTQQQNELRAYNNALMSNDTAVLDNFLAVYPNASQEHRDSIHTRLIMLNKTEFEWTDCLDDSTSVNYKSFIKNHPDNIHVTEAVLKIDSLDYVATTKINTAEAYQAYLDAHPDGYYIDEALLRFEQMNALRLKPEERESIATVINRLVEALAADDKATLSSILTPPVSTFMGQAPTVDDYLSQWHKQLDGDVTSVRLALSDDWEIEKVLPTQSDASITYSVSVSVTERLERTDASLQRVVPMRLSAVLSPDFHVQSLKLRKVRNKE